MSNEVLAVVAGKEITNAELDAFLQNAPREQQAYVTNPQFRQQYLEQLISLHLFAQAGEDAKLEETEEFAKILENAKRDILAQLAMRETLKDVTVTDEEVDSEEKCTSVLESITSGEKAFEDAAKEASTCPSGARGGDLGEFGKGQMVKEFEEAAFAAEIGHVVGPVKTQFGYHLIKVEKKNEASVAAFDEVKEAIKRNLIQQKQNAAYNAKVQELKEKYLQK